MATITLKGIPPKLHQSLKERARRHGRSLNREVIASLERVVGQRPESVDELRVSARRPRESIAGRIDQKLLDDAKAEHRG